MNPNPPPTSSSLQLASILVARFLRSNNYTQTLEAFIREAGLPPDAGQVGGGGAGSGDDDDGWTIEGVIEEKRAFDQSLKFERYGEGDDGKEKWSVPGEYVARWGSVFEMNRYSMLHIIWYLLLRLDVICGFHIFDCLYRKRIL